MEQFKVSENALKNVLKTILQKMIPLSIFIFIGVIGFNFFLLKDIEEEQKKQIIQILVPILVIALVLSIYLVQKRLKAQLRSYVLTITDTEIIREQLSTPTIRHLKSDITEITKYSNGAIGIKTQSIKDLIGVPSQIEDSERLESLLNQIIPIKVLDSKTWLERSTMPIVVLPIILFGGFFISKNIWVVEILGSFLIGLLIYSLFLMYNNKNADNRTKLLMFFVLLPMIGIVNKMYVMASPQYTAKQLSDKKELIQKDTIEDELLTTIDIFRNAKAEDAKDFENGLITGIEVDKLETFIQDLNKPDEIVLQYNEVSLEIDYPLDILYKATLKPKGKGFTRKELLKEISKRYHQIYEEEEATATTKTIPRDKRDKLINRNTTDGKYGIWGHDLSDLYLTGIEVYKTKDGKIVLRLNVDS